MKIKIISLITLACFLLTNFTGTIQAGITYSSLTYNEAFDIETIAGKNNLSLKYGQIEEAVYKRGAPLAVIINDFHNNPVVQSNIEQIINFLKQSSHLDKVIIEGAPDRQINTGLFSSIPEAQQRIYAADKMLKKGMLSGAESFGIKNNFVNLFGLEQWDIYRGNLLRAEELHDKYAEDINTLEKSFAKQRRAFPKGKVFSILSHDNSTDERIFKIGRFCRENNIDLSIYPDLYNFIYMQQFPYTGSVSKEFGSFINDLKKELPYSVYAYISGLLKQSNNISTNLALLFEIAKLYSPQTLIKYENLAAYFKHIEIKISIRSYLLLRQLDAAENMILDRYAGFTERDLAQTDRFIYLLSEYANLSLTYEQYLYFLSNKELLYQASFKYLDMNSMKIIKNILNDEKLSDFYAVNLERNNIFYGNIKNLLNLEIKDDASVHNKAEDTEQILNDLKYNKSVNIIVVGGFHSRLIDMLKNSEVSVLSIVPNAEDVDLSAGLKIAHNNIVYQNALAPPAVCVQADIRAIAMLISGWQESLNQANVDSSRQKTLICEWLDKNNINLLFDFNVSGEPVINGVPLTAVLTKEIKIVGSPVEKRQRGNFQENQEKNEVSESVDGGSQTEIKIIEKVRNSNSQKTTITDFIRRYYSKIYIKVFDFLWSLNNIKFKIYSYWLNTGALFGIAKNKIEKITGKVIFSRDVAGISSEYLSRKLLDERIIQNEYKRTLNSLNGDMPDLLILTVDNMRDIEYCNNILADMKRHPKFANVTVKYIIKDGSGTGTGFIQALEYLQHEKAPELGNSIKRKQDVKCVIIDINDANRNIIGSSSLPLQIDGRNITPLELAVLNGIRSCHKFQNSGGLAVIDPGSIYIGNMVPTGDITFISSGVSFKEIQNRRMSLVIKEHPDKLEQIYYGFNPDKISDIVERKGIEYKNYYNFDNKEIKQFEVITGNILIKFEDETNYLKFFNFISAIGAYSNRGKTAINLIQHIFVPFVRANHNAKAQSYFAKTRPKDEKEEERSFFLGLAELFNSKNNDIINKTRFGVYRQSKSFYGIKFSKETFDKLSAIVKAKQIDLSYKKKIDSKKQLRRRQREPVYKSKEDSSLSRGYFLLSKIQNKQIDSLVDYEQSYETLIEIVRTTALQRQLYTTDNADTAKLYIYMSDLISDIIADINGEMESGKSRIDRIYLENLKITFLSLQNYIIEYIRLLDYTSNLATLGGYVYPKDSWFEKYKLMPFNRFVFGFSRGIKRAKEDIRRQLATVYSSGNFLIESLYSFPVIKRDMESFIEGFENPKEKTAVGMQREWGSRRAIQRFLSLTIALQSFTTTIITNISTSNFFSSGAVGTALFSLATGVGLSVFLHRSSISIGWNNKFYNKKKKEIETELAGQDNVKHSVEFFSYNKKIFSKLKKFLIKLSKDDSLNEETKMLVYNSLNLLNRYKLQYDLQTVDSIYANCWKIKPFISGSDDKAEMDEFMEYFRKTSINDVQKYEEAIGRGFLSNAEIIRNETGQCLSKWMSILENGKISKNNIDLITGNAVQIIQLTSFSSDTLKGTNKDSLISELQDFISFYEKTVYLCKKLPKTEQEKLQPEIEILEKTGEYAVMYYKALNYLVSAEILYGYRISKGSKMYFLEMTGLMSIVRKIYGIETGIYLSRKNFKNEIIKVKNLGNELIPGLYDSKVEQSINEFFNEKAKPQYFYLGINESWKVRKMLARFLPLIFFGRSVLSSVLANSFSLNGVVISFFTGVGLSLILHWLPILSGFFKTKKIKQKKLFPEKLQNGGNSVEINKQLLLQKQINKLSEAPYGDIPDLVIIAGNKTEYTTDLLEKSVYKITTYGNLKNLNIENLLLDNDGGSGNSLIDIFGFLQSDKFKKKYPQFAGRDLSELKIVAVNIDGTSPSLITKPLDMEIISQKTTPVELALLNGISLMQNYKKDGGNIIIVDPAYMYLGSLEQTNNITLLSSNISYEQMESQKLPLFISNPADSLSSGGTRLKKIYNKFNNTTVANIVVKYMLDKLYDIDNLSIQQMQTFSGIIAMSFFDKNKFQNIMKFINAAKEYERSYKGKKFQIDTMAHLLIPLTRIANNEDIFVYLENLKYSADKNDKEDYDRFFWGLFKHLNENLQINEQTDDSYINILPAHDSLMTKVDSGNGKFYKKFITISGLLKQFNFKRQAVSVKREISSFILPQKKTAVFMSPRITDIVKRHITAFDNDETNNFTITMPDQLSDNKKDSGIIINVPVENTVIPARVIYDIFTDDSGKNHVIAAFLPVLFDDADMYCSVREIEIINSILSGTESDINKIRKKVFNGRAVLALIKELKQNKGGFLMEEDISFVMQKIDPATIVSFDGFGIFAVPETVSDAFVKDQQLNSLRHINIDVSGKQNEYVPLELIKQMNMSNSVREYNIIKEDKFNLSVLAALVSNYSFSFDELDIPLLLNDPSRYSRNMMSAADENGSPEGIAGKINNIRILPSMKLQKFSGALKYAKLLSDISPDKIILNNVLIQNDSFKIRSLLNFKLIDIGAEIDRLNRGEFIKLKELLNITDFSSQEMSTNEIFVLNNLFNYLKSDEKEYGEYLKFINNRAANFYKELEFLTASQINKQIRAISGEDIETLKKQNTDKWSFYYGLNEYMQYIAYMQYSDMCRRFASEKIRTIVSCDFSAGNGKQEFILSELLNLKELYGFHGFYIKGLSVNAQEQPVKFLRANIRDDVTLIFDNMKSEQADYTNTYIVSDGLSQSRTADSLSEELIKIDLHNDNVRAFEDKIKNLSGKYKLALLLADISDVFDSTEVLKNIFSINNMFKENSKTFEYYSQNSAKAALKYQKSLSRDTANGIIGTIDISEINGISGERLFNYAEKILSDANIGTENYKTLLRYINKLKINYDYAGYERQKIMLAQLKGYLTGIYDCQKVINPEIQSYKVNIMNINSILCSA